MTDANGMTFTNLTLSKNQCVAGETLTASITLKNNTGANIPSMDLYICCTRADFSGDEKDRIKSRKVFGFATQRSLGKGKTETYTWTSTFDYGGYAAKLFGEYPDVRAVPLYIGYEVRQTENSGFGREDYKVDDLVFLNAYYHPQVADMDLQRTIGGVPNDEGEDILSTLRLALDDAQGTKFMQVHLHYAENAAATEDSTYLDLTPRIPELLTGVTDSADILMEPFSNGSNWDFLLVFGDQYESARARYTLSRAFANMHLSGEPTGGACFGGFSSSTLGNPKLESHYPGFFYAGIHGVTNYAEEEVLTGGRWIDNKPIYRRVLKIGDIAASGTGSASIGSGALGELVSLRAHGKRGDHIRAVPFAHSTSTADAWLYISNWASDDPKVSVGVGSSGHINDVIAIVEYTKAADAPIEPAATHMAFADSDGRLIIDANNSRFMTLTTEVY